MWRRKRGKFFRVSLKAKTGCLNEGWDARLDAGCSLPSLPGFQCTPALKNGTHTKFLKDRTQRRKRKLNWRRKMFSFLQNILKGEKVSAAYSRSKWSWMGLWAWSCVLGVYCRVWVNDRRQFDEGQLVEIQCREIGVYPWSGFSIQWLVLGSKIGHRRNCSLLKKNQNLLIAFLENTENLKRVRVAVELHWRAVSNSKMAPVRCCCG